MLNDKDTVSEAFVQSLGGIVFSAKNFESTLEAGLCSVRWIGRSLIR